MDDAVLQHGTVISFDKSDSSTALFDLMDVPSINKRVKECPGQHPYKHPKETVTNFENFTSLLLSETFNIRDLRKSITMNDEQNTALYKKIWDIFKQFDRHGEGLIRTGDLEALMRTLSIDFSPEKLARAAKLLDPKSSGVIEIIDFMDYMAYCYDDQKERESLREALQAFEDEQSKGFISVKELKHHLLSMGEGLSEAEIIELMKEVGINDGMIEIDNVVDKILFRQDDLPTCLKSKTRFQD